MSLKKITALEAKSLIDQGAILVDVRDPSERARISIPGSKSMPLSALGKDAELTRGATAVIFHCKSGMRTGGNAKALSQCIACEGYMLEGGIDGWAAAGLPVNVDRSQPIEIMRQVQITAGGLVLLGVLLGAYASPVFYGIAAFVGAGLIFAGASGWCGMAKLLALMPWNRKAAAAVAA